MAKSQNAKNINKKEEKVNEFTAVFRIKYITKNTIRYDFVHGAPYLTQLYLNKFLFMEYGAIPRYLKITFVVTASKSPETFTVEILSQKEISELTRQKQ